MRLLYRLAADLVLLVHFGYVAFVVVGLLLIFAGALRRWAWVRNFWFRLAHLLAIGIVVVESWFGVTCPLTVWERQLRELAGQEAARGDFIARWVHRLMFFDFGSWVFTLGYTLFGLAVLATFFLAPPRLPSRAEKDRHGS